MLKLSSRLLHYSRASLVQRIPFNETTSDFRFLRSISSDAGTSSSMATLLRDAKSTAKIHASYTIFKGKAALSADPCLPTFSKLDNGDYRVDRRGSIMLTLWPAIGERKYDWEKRQRFALSATEVGSLINLGSNDSCEFFHDPAMLTSEAGQVRKSLSIKANSDGNGYLISLNVVNNILKTNDRLYVPVTGAEFAVLRTAFTYALPHIMGWDKCTNQVPQQQQGSNQSSYMPQIGASEWER